MINYWFINYESVSQDNIKNLSPVLILYKVFEELQDKALFHTLF